MNRKNRRRKNLNRIKLSVMCIFAVLCTILPFAAEFASPDSSFVADAAPCPQISGLGQVPTAAGTANGVTVHIPGGVGANYGNDGSSLTVDAYGEVYARLNDNNDAYMYQFRADGMSPLGGVGLGAYGTDHPYYNQFMVDDDNKGASFFIRGFQHNDYPFYELTANAPEYHGGPGLYFNIVKDTIYVTLKFLASDGRVGGYANGFPLADASDPDRYKITILDDPDTNVVTIFSGSEQILLIKMSDIQDIGTIYTSPKKEKSMTLEKAYTDVTISDKNGNVYAYGYNPEDSTNPNINTITKELGAEIKLLVPGVNSSCLGLAVRGGGRITMSELKIDYAYKYAENRSEYNLYAKAGGSSAQSMGWPIATIKRNAGASNLLRNQGGMFTFQSGNAQEKDAAGGQPNNPMMENNNANRVYGFRGACAFYSKFGEALPGDATSYTFYVDVVDGCEEANDDDIFIRSLLPAVNEKYSPLYEAAFADDNYHPNVTGVSFAVNKGKIYVRIRYAITPVQGAAGNIGMRGVAIKEYVYDLNNATTKVGFLDNESDITIFEIVGENRRVITKILVGTTPTRQNDVVGAKFEEDIEGGGKIVHDHTDKHLWEDQDVFSNEVKIRRPDGIWETISNPLVSVNINGSVLGIATRGFGDVVLRLRSIHFSSKSSSSVIDDWLWLYDGANYDIINNYEMDVFKRVVEAGRTFDDGKLVTVWDKVENVADTSEVPWKNMSNFNGVLHTYAAGFSGALLENGTVYDYKDSSFNGANFKDLYIENDARNPEVATTLDCTLDNTTITGLFIYDGKADLTVNSGSYNSIDIRPGTANATIIGGTVKGAVATSGGTTTVKGGTINSILTSGTGKSIVNGGTIASMTTSGGSATINGGTVTGDVLTLDGTSTITGGKVGSVSTENIGKSTISGGTVGSVATRGGNAIINSGATVTGAVATSGGTTTIEGGNIGSVYTSDSGVAIVNGGTVGSMSVAGGTVTTNGGTINDIVSVTGGELNINKGVYKGKITRTEGTVNIAADTVVAEHRYFGATGSRDTQVSIYANDAFTTDLSGDWNLLGEGTVHRVTFGQTLPAGTRFTVVDAATGRAYFCYVAESGVDYLDFSIFTKAATTNAFALNGALTNTQLLLAVDFSSVSAEDMAAICGTPFTVTHQFVGDTSSDTSIYDIGSVEVTVNTVPTGSIIVTGDVNAPEHSITGTVTTTFPNYNGIPDSYQVGVIMAIKDIDTGLYVTPHGFDVSVNLKESEAVRFFSSHVYIPLGSYSQNKGVEVSTSYVIGGLLKGEYKVEFHMTVVDGLGITNGIANGMNRVINSASTGTLEVGSRENYFSVDFGSIDESTTPPESFIIGVGEEHCLSFAWTSNIDDAIIIWEIYKYNVPENKYESVEVEGGSETSDVTVILPNDLDEGAYRITFSIEGRPDIASVYHYVFINGS